MPSTDFIAITYVDNANLANNSAVFMTKTGTRNDGGAEGSRDELRER